MRDATETVSGQATTSAAPLLDAGTRIADRYRIESVLGVGGSAVVYRAFDERLSGHVALKLMRSDRITPAALMRFRREVAVARTIESEHVVRIHDIGDSDYGVFITMELGDGESLRTRIERGPLSVAETIEIAKQILDGLTELHRINVVHRDIKPGNILIRSDGRVKIADLGLARNVEGDEFRATQTDAVVGTWEYLAPEQALGRAVDARTDLYSFGIVVYECLAGTLPFTSGSSIEGVLARLREKPRDIRTVRPDVPRWLAALIERLLAKEPQDRFASAEEVRRWLDRRRAPLPWKKIAKSAAVSLIVTAMAIAFAMWWNRPRFAKLTGYGELGTAVVDGDGRTLWKLENTQPRCVAIVRQRGRVRWIAAIEGVNDVAPPSRRSLLKFFSPDTGRIEWTTMLDNPGTALYQFPDAFTVDHVVAADPDHDGNDVIIASFAHVYWPSYTVVFDPARRNTRFIFTASGHHRFVGLADVNGDGHDDLLLGGINNRMGWYSGLAAIDIPPREPSSAGVFSGSTPDAGDSETGRPLLWYTLLPPSHSVGLAGARIAPDRRQVLIPMAERPIRLDFDGFMTPCPRGMSPAQRQAARTKAYDDLRRAERLIGGSEPREAITAASSAADAARKADDAILVQWCERVRLRAMVSAGDDAAANRLASELMATVDAPNDVAFEVATTLHRNGRLKEAVRWYREGLVRATDASIGRPRYEFMQGGVLAAVEEKDWNASEDIVSMAVRIGPRLAFDGVVYTNYIRWAQGRTDLVLPRTIEALGNRHEFRYWFLEFTWATAHSPAMLPQLDAEIERGSMLEGLLLSLKSEILAASGKKAEALKLARTADEWCAARGNTDVFIRAHAGLVRSRLEHLQAR